MRLVGASPPCPFHTKHSFFSPVFLYFFLQQNTCISSFHPSSFHSITLTLSPPLPLYSEYLVGASPEMFVRVKKKTFEKGKKMRITESTGTQTYGGLGGCELDTGGRAARRIFLREGVVQGRSRSGAACGGGCEISKKVKKGESLNQP